MAGKTLKGRSTAITVMMAGLAVLAAVAAVLHGASTPQGKSFGYVDPAFTQELFGTTSSFMRGGLYLGGVAVLPNGDAIAAECVQTGTRLHRFSGTLTVSKNGTSVHVETILPSAGGCGIVYHPDGTLYLNMNDGAHGVANVNATTGALIRYLGTPGNAVGIAVDPVSSHIVYADKNCVSTTKPPITCTLIDVDTVTGAAANRMAFPIANVSFVNGIYFDPAGSYLFLTNRYPVPRVTVVTSAGTIVQDVDMAGSDPVGLGFSAASPKFVVTNNTDGSMSRFDFPGDDYTQVPTPGTLALFGYRGDLMQAGPDGCLYVTQGGARYDDGTDVSGTKANSLARICGGFAPPAGVPTNPPPIAQGTLQGTVTDAVTGNPLTSAKVLVATGTGLSVLTDGTGRYALPLAPGTYTATASATDYSSVITSAIVIVNASTTTTDFALMPLPGTLQGVVTNALTGAAVSGALVALSNGKSDLTDSAGRYVINSIVPGTYAATITQTYYDTLNVASVAVPINATATANFALTQTPGTIQGTVTGNTGPIAAATVTLSNGALATTGAAGQYAFAAVTPGVYSATAKAATFSSAATSGISLPNAGSKTVDFTLTPLPGVLLGHVTNTAGAALNGATVTLSNGKSDKTDASGLYSITNLTPGTYGVTITMTNYDLYTAAGIVIGNAATVTYDASLRQTPGPISGVVRDTLANPLAGATVTLSNGSTTATDGTGSYLFASVVPGTYSVTASLATYASTTVNGVVLLNASFKKQDITLSALPGSLSGTVKNAAGQPIASAVVSLSGGKSATTDASGFYKIISLAPATYTATITASNYNSRTVAGIVIANATNVTQDVVLTQTPGTLKGTVVNASNVGITNATVLLSNGASAITDGTGSYTMSIPPGTYSATVTASNYNTATTPAGSPIVIVNAGTTTRNFTLSQTPGKLTGTVTAAGSTMPIAGASVTLSNGGGSVSTDATGIYTFASLAPGTYTATVSAATFNASSAAGIVIANAATTTRNFSLVALKADLVVAAAAPATGSGGTTVAYSFVVSNRLSLAAAGVTVTHTLPAQTSFVSLVAPAGWNCVKPAAGLGGTVTCTKASMAVGETATFALSAMIACPFNSATLVESAAATTTSADADPTNNTGSASIAITNPAPTITGAAVDTATMWPPNHKMWDVQVLYTLAGSCGAAAKATLSISSDEGTSDDYQMIDAHHVKLRAERLGSSNGRVYTITISATVDGKAITNRNVTVSVVHDQGNGK